MTELREADTGGASLGGCATEPERVGGPGNAGGLTATSDGVAYAMQQVAERRGDAAAVVAAARRADAGAGFGWFEKA